MQGYFKCQHCGTLLRVTGYKNRFLLFYIPVILVLGLAAGFLYQSLAANVGSGLGSVLGVLLLVTIIALTISIWKNTRVEKVDTDPATMTNSST